MNILFQFPTAYLLGKIFFHLPQQLKLDSGFDMNLKRFLFSNVIELKKKKHEFISNKQEQIMYQNVWFLMKLQLFCRNQTNFHNFLTIARTSKNFVMIKKTFSMFLWLRVYSLFYHIKRKNAFHVNKMDALW